MRKFFDEVLLEEDKSISITYYIIKAGSFYGVEAIQRGGFDDGGNSVIFIQTGSFNDIRRFARLIAKGKVMPALLVDVANDFLVNDSEADSE